MVAGMLMEREGSNETPSRKVQVYARERGARKRKCWEDKCAGRRGKKRTVKNRF